MNNKYLRLASVIIVAASAVNAGEIGYNEKFSLAADRQQALKELIPGTQEYYYYNALQLQHEKKFAEAQKMIDAGIKKYGHSSLLRELENRQALLTYEQNKDRSLKYIIERLNLHFNHRQKQLNPEIKLPTALSENSISFRTLASRAFHEKRHTARFESSAIDYLMKADLNEDQRRHLLGRLSRPDYPGVVDKIIADLKYKHSRGWGHHNVHGMLTVEQLEGCLTRMPELIKNTNFINTYLRKLRPSEDVDWTINDEEHLAYLDRLMAFADRLPPAQNSLKANILFKRLQFDHERGKYDRALFDRYVKLPRPVHYVNQDWLRRGEFRDSRVNMSASYQSLIAIPPIGGDEPLVRDYLMHFLKDAKDFSAFSDYIEHNYLKRLFAEMKLVNGLGDAEQWYAMMTPSEVKNLRDRVDIQLLPTNRKQYGVKDAVSLNVAVKNVKDLKVKVFELNTTGYYRQNLSEITTAIELDGLVANSESAVKYELPSMRRHVEKLDFPQIKQPGVYVVELIGNGVSSRAVIRKGRLTHTERIGAAGHVFQVFDDAGNLVTDAALWINGREFKAEDKSGEITVPFSGSPGQQQIVITRKGFSVLTQFQHTGESYSLKAPMHIAREQLVAGKQCTVTVRPELLLNGEPIDVSLLEDPVLTIRSVDIDGLSAEKQQNDFKLHNDRESTYTFRVPERLRAITIYLSGSIQNLNTGQKEQLSASRSLTLNRINETDKTEDLVLRHTADGYYIEDIGRNAEARSERPVSVELKHRDFTETVNVSLKSGPDGRVKLGQLKDIVWVRAKSAQDTSHTWTLPADKSSRATVLHMLAGDTMRIPVMDTDDRPLAETVSLLETRSQVFVRDCISCVKKQGGYLVVSGLEPGDYSLLTKPDNRVTVIRVTEGASVGSQLIGKTRVLEQRAAYPLQITGIDVKDGKIDLQIANAVPGTRVHLAMSRYVTDDVFAQLGTPSFRAPTGARLAQPESQYISGRRIGDEYRYVMERRTDKIYPGNMLTRPSLILNPWSPRETSTGTDDAALGGMYGSRSPGSRGVAYEGGSGGRRSGGSSGDDFSCFDFLKDVSPVALNLTPGKDGKVSIPLKSLPAGQQLHVYAVNSDSSVYRSLALQERPEDTKDLRLTRFLLPDKHFTEQKRTTLVRQGEKFTVADILSAKIEIVDSLPAAYRLLTALNDDGTLAEFNFILTWNKLSAEKKAELYKKYACHELHVFLARKDPAFFKEAIKPYLANKKDATFVDEYLLGRSLTKYLRPWEYSRLNMVERAMLGQQLKAQHASTARHLKDLYDLVPPNIERFNTLFYSVLRSSGLDGSVGLEEVMAEAEAAFDEVALVKSPVVMDAKGGSYHGRLSAPKPAAARESMKRKLEKSLAVSETAVLDALSSDFELAKNSAATWKARKAQDSRAREAVRQFYRKLEKTKEWVEQNYFRQPIQSQVSDLVGINAFWKDYAAWDGKSAFLSGNIAEAGGSFTEMLLALAALDLPFEAGKHDYNYKDGGLEFAAANDVIIFHKQVSPAEKGAEKSVLLVNQSFFANDDKYRYEDNERFDKFVTGEFEKGRVYGCRMVLTNPTSTRRKVDILQQIPAGSMPVLKGMQTRSTHAVLEPYSTRSLEYYFYFPATGEFVHYPVHIAQNEKVVAAAEPMTFTVVDRVDEIDKESWEHISQFASNDEVLAYLEKNNIDRLDLTQIAWRVRDKAFFGKVVSLLQDRKVFNPILWSYSIHHRDTPRMREYLPHTYFASQSGMIIDSPVLTVDPIETHRYEHKEYWPLVNARTFKLGGKRKILNAQFYSQYEMFMKMLTYRPALTDEDRMGVVIYMLLQDRIEEALGFFDQIKPANLEMAIQHDYMAAYMAFYREDPKTARKIASKYKSYPAERWRNLFGEVLAQCDEIDGKGTSVTDSEDRTQQQTQLAATEPRIELEVEGGGLKVTHANLESCTVNYYPMDIELLFSNKPFVQDVGDKFTVVKPHHSDTVKLKGEATDIALPKELKDRNLMIEVTAAGISRMKAYYPNALTVDIAENYGQLRVADKKNGRALSKVYVKVYARTGDGSATFFKDGYTDLRGRFDYTSLNTDEIDSVGRFAILIMSDTHGAMVREAAPPKR